MRISWSSVAQLAIFFALGSSIFAVAIKYAAPLHAGGSAPAATGEELLSGFDFVPSKEEFDQAFTDPVTSLLTQAANAQHPLITRVRSLRALSLYNSQNAVDYLTTTIISLRGASLGADTMRLRAALNALAESTGPNSVSVIAPELENPSRDVRTSAARALQKTGSISAVNFLRSRLAIEQELQVRIALSAAIRDLEGIEN